MANALLENGFAVKERDGAEDLVLAAHGDLIIGHCVRGEGLPPVAQRDFAIQHDVKAPGVRFAFLANTLARIEAANADMPLQSIAPVLRQPGEKGDLIEREAVA